MSSKKLSAALAAFVLASLVPTAAGAITREETLVRARSYASYPWSATTTNLTATCKASYKSIYYVGDFVGLPYNWGGYQTLAEFDQRIASGQAAGAQPDDGVLDCTAGVDCSGFVSKAWNVGHFTTSDLDQTSSAIQKADLQNPHSAIYVLASMPSGEAVVWAAETGGPGSLADKIKSGAKPLPIKQYFATGQKVKVTVHPRRDGEHTGSLVRMAIRPYAGTVAAYPSVGDPAVHVRGSVPITGGVRTYQAWHRDTPLPCGSNSNLSNGLSVIWIP
mgnify:CR=1 FL=1